MEERLVDEVNVDEKITVRLFDKSRILAGDRYYVCLEARADIPFSIEDLDGLPEKEKTYQVLKELYGEHIPYSYLQERHFIDKNEKEGILKAFLENFYKHKLPYLRNPLFRKGAILAKVKELRQRRPQLFFT